MNRLHTSIFVMVVGCTIFPTQGFSTIPDTLRQRIDSLLVVANSSHGLQKYEAEFQIAYDLFDVDNVVAVTHASMAFESIRNGDDTTRIVTSGRLYGQLLRRIGKTEEAGEIFQSILPLAERIEGGEEMARILQALSFINIQRGEFDRALTNNLKALRIRQANRDSIGMAQSFVNIGFLYYKLEYHSEAAKYFEKAIIAGDSIRKALAYINLGLSKLSLKRTSEFPMLARQSLHYTPARETLINRIQYHYGFGWYFLQVGMVDSAELHYERALRYASEFGDDRMTAEAQMGLARSALRRGDYDRSILLLTGVERDLSHMELDQVRALCYRTLSEALENKKLWRQALIYRRKQGLVEDSIFDRGMQNNMAVARVEYEEKENQLMISQQANLIALKDEVINQQKQRNAASISLVLVAFGLLVTLYRFNRYQKRISIELDKKVCERTKELQCSENALTKSLGEQGAMMDLVSRKVHASVATLRGLWHVKEVGAEPAFEKFEITVNDLLVVSRIMDRSSSLRSGLTGDTAHDHSEQSTGRGLGIH